jgi:hypothetical protein
MHTDLAGELKPTSPRRTGWLQKAAIFAAKLLVTGGCLWYVARQIELGQVLSAIALLDFRWAGFAAVLLMAQIPLVALRWRNILVGLGACDARTTRAAMTAITAIGVFFSQVLPAVASEGVRAWLLIRRGCDWRSAVTSVIIDRGVGTGLLVALGFVILLLPSGLAAFGGYRRSVLVVYGALLLGGALALWLAPRIVPLLGHWRYSRWIGTLVADVRRVLLGPRAPVILAIGCLIHSLTIVALWSLGRAQGLMLPVADAAVLFIVMVGVALVPISISGWGLRELAVVSILGANGVAPERALLFSICFGLTLAAASLPGALAWLLYSVAPAPRSAERGG